MSAHPAVAPAPGTSRAGRDLPVAVAVGLGLLVAVAASLFIRKEVFGVVAIVAVGAGLWELTQAFARRGVHIPVLPLLVGDVGILVSAYVAGMEALFVAFVLTVGGIVAAMVLGCTLPSLRTEVFNEQRKPAWREATRAMLERARRPVVVLAVREPHMYYRTVDYYLPDGAPVISAEG